MKIKIITDSTSNLSHEQAKRFDLDMIPAFAIIDEIEYIDDGSTPPDEFYNLIDNSESAKTSQPSPHNVWEALERNKDYDHLLLILVSEKLSGTISVVTNVVKQYQRENKDSPEITIIDSLGSSFFLGSIAIKAAQLLRKGLELEELIKQIKHFRDNDVQVFLMVTDLTHIYQSGRIGRIQYYLADFLHAYPILTLQNGALNPVGKDIGIERTCKKLLDLVKECYKKDDEIFVWLAETVPREENEEFKQMVEKIKEPKIKRIEKFKVGNAIVCHTGITVMGLITARNFELD